MNHEQKKGYMQRALEIAHQGEGSVSPNPLVGCILVKKGKIIGEGYHEYYGGNHAEINALADAKKRRNNPRGADLFVTLEPCHHTGKTSPCTHALVKEGIARIFFAMPDPNLLATGGKKFLEENGISVETGILQKESELMNTFFIHNVTQKRSFFLGKAAISADGFLTKKKGSSTVITGKETNTFFHQWRRRCDGILVGVNTVLIDDPQLTARHKTDSHHFSSPVKIVLDPHLRLLKSQKKYRLFEEGETLLIASEKTEDLLPPPHTTLLKIPEKKGILDLSFLAKKLLKQNIGSLLIEGGNTTLCHFAETNLLDAMYIAQSSEYFSQGLLLNKKSILKNLSLQNKKEYGSDTIKFYGLQEL